MIARKVVEVRQPFGNGVTLTAMGDRLANSERTRRFDQEPNGGLADTRLRPVSDQETGAGIDSEGERD